MKPLAPLFSTLPRPQDDSPIRLLVPGISAGFEAALPELFQSEPSLALEVFDESSTRVESLKGKSFVNELPLSALSASVRNFHLLSLPAHHFHGVFGSGILDLLPPAGLERFLYQVFKALVPQGVLFASSLKPDSPPLESTLWMMRQAGFEVFGELTPPDRAEKGLLARRVGSS